MKRLYTQFLVILLLLFGITSNGFSQQTPEFMNNLKRELINAKEDTVKLKLLYLLANGYRFSNVDSSFHYSDMGIKMAADLGLPVKKARFLFQVKCGPCLPARVPEI